MAALNQFLEAIVQRKLGAQFQPIIDLHSAGVMGYEALIRMPKDGALKRHGHYYEQAGRARLSAWLGVACQEQCFASVERQGLRHYLFLNMDAGGLEFMRHGATSIADRAKASGIPLDNIVLEITFILLA